MQLHRSTGNFWLGFVLATTTMLLWASLPIALKLLLTHLDPTSIIAARFVIASLLLGIALRARGRQPRLRDLRGGRWVLLVVATVFLAGNYLFYMLGLDRTTAANAQVLIQLAPLLLALGGIFVFREHFVRLQWLGFAVLVAGLVMFSWDQVRAFVDSFDRYVSGSAMMVAAAFTWAVYGLAQKQLLAWWPSQSIMLCVYAGCALLFLPWSDAGAMARLDAAGLGLLLYAALNTLVAYGCFSEALAHWEASRVAAVLALTPLTTLVLVVTLERWAPAWVEAERLGGLSLAGAGLVVAGSILVALGQRWSRAA